MEYIYAHNYEDYLLNFQVKSIIQFKNNLVSEVLLVTTLGKLPRLMIVL